MTDNEARQLNLRVAELAGGKQRREDGVLNAGMWQFRVGAHGKTYCIVDGGTGPTHIEGSYTPTFEPATDAGWAVFAAERSKLFRVGKHSIREPVIRQLSDQCWTFGYVWAESDEDYGQEFVAQGETFAECICNAIVKVCGGGK